MTQIRPLHVEGIDEQRFRQAAYLYEFIQRHVYSVHAFLVAGTPVVDSKFVAVVHHDGFHVECGVDFEPNFRAWDDALSRLSSLIDRQARPTCWHHIYRDDQAYRCEFASGPVHIWAHSIPLAGLEPPDDTAGAREATDS